MRWYVIDELTREDASRIDQALSAREDMKSPLEGLYYLSVPHELLSEEQKAHADECGPHVMGLETDTDFVRLELLVRARGRMRCSCVHYASPEARAWAINYVDAFIRELDIPV
ncbi:hypothetical protein dsat_1575 [Alkalidesulfovibrio alkalitolerans DSM 16529]|jgi:hypothetical protein|uniref:Uncharacterized protein n=1 Tax=Alkalidesulfovibrio alkalitolerans DSM 16529 TaxID=1121439 RepID=S7T1Q0_9BACT|nr:hypothetical protein [Alkalidesulfovibrio alkalitolerans]EPR30435.1 hypothetical protein dsat_1575 [Alkalidesulfovibrio alkalitolerans DSM 16529]